MYNHRKAGRKQLDVLLKDMEDMENMEAHLPPEQRFDHSQLRWELLEMR